MVGKQAREGGAVGTCCAVRDERGFLHARDFSEDRRDDRPRQRRGPHGRARRSRAQGRHQDLGGEAIARVDDVRAGRAGSAGLETDLLEVLGLTEVNRDSHDFGAGRCCQPRDLTSRLGTAGVSEHKRIGHFSFLVPGPWPPVPGPWSLAPGPLGTNERAEALRQGSGALRVPRDHENRIVAGNRSHDVG